MEFATDHMDNSPYIEVIPQNGVNVEASFHQGEHTIADELVFVSNTVG